MQVYDISVPLSDSTPTYPDDPGIQITQWRSLVGGDSANVSRIQFGTHSGTHVDAPAHFIQGAYRVESLPLDILIGEAQVIEVPSAVSVIDESFIANTCQAGVQRVLFKTRNSTFWSDQESSFRTDYTYIDSTGARKLVGNGAKLVGIDYLSVEKFKSAEFETHRILLSNRIVIVEGLDLRGVSAGTYELICLPLRIAGGSGDGAPARAVLRGSAKNVS